MKGFNSLTLSVHALAAASLASPVSAAVAIDWVTVGNVGNTADTTGYGSVDYEYQIGKYEVTYAQYAEFLNAKAATDTYSLYNINMLDMIRSGNTGSYTYTVGEDSGNRPIGFVSWFSAARFANWLTNGQGSGDTETGSYTLNGAMNGIVTANSGARIHLPTENEWYKAAYYNGATSTYSLYPNGQNTITTADANYGGDFPFATGPGMPTDVGTWGVPSYYGTYDQGGNVSEWNDAIIGSSRGVRGGSWYEIEENNPILENDGSYVSALASSVRGSNTPATEGYFVGFRVASVPEPSAMLLTMLASGVMLAKRKR